MLSIYWKKPVFGLDEGFNPDDQKALLFGDYHDSAIDFNVKCNYLILGLNRKSGQSLIRVHDATSFRVVKEIEVDFKIDFLRGQLDLVLV
jgi:hypothetical protein